eukprot:6107081-Amphidinium_carterae.2
MAFFKVQHIGKTCDCFYAGASGSITRTVLLSEVVLSYRVEVNPNTLFMTFRQETLPVFVLQSLHCACGKARIQVASPSGGSVAVGRTAVPNDSGTPVHIRSKRCMQNTPESCGNSIDKLREYSSPTLTHTDSETSSSNTRLKSSQQLRKPSPATDPQIPKWSHHLWLSDASDTWVRAGSRVGRKLSARSTDARTLGTDDKTTARAFPMLSNWRSKWVGKSPLLSPRQPRYGQDSHNATVF